METNFNCNSQNQDNIVVVYYSDSEGIANRGVGNHPGIVLGENYPNEETAVAEAHKKAIEYKEKGFKGQIAAQRISVSNIAYETL